MTGTTVTVNIQTNYREEMVNITSSVADAVKKSGIKEGICCVFVPHTTAGVTINENADPDVPPDILKGIKSLRLEEPDYSHMEGNSPAHIKSTLTGSSQLVIIDNGKLLLGTWQGIFFCEFDGPRSRKVYVKVTGD
jgi:secondary thiamine-phosphate synthase enzyme